MERSRRSAAVQDSHGDQCRRIDRTVCVLGSAIRRVATSVKREDIFHLRNSLAGLVGDGMADSEPLARLVASIRYTGASRGNRTLIETQGISDVHRIYETPRQDGVDPNLAYIGADFVAKSHARFDSAYMKRLFDYTYQAGARGYAWQKVPPSEPRPGE